MTARTTKITESTIHNLLGKEVRCTTGETGRVVLITDGDIFPITVRFETRYVNFKKDGYCSGDLYYIEVLNVEKPAPEDAISIEAMERILAFMKLKMGLDKLQALDWLSK
jgi:hypothetical protein